MKKRAILPALVGILTILLLANVLAVGITSPYWDERPLLLAAGETKDIKFELQNMVGNENVTMRAKIIEGEKIAQITDENEDYIVPIGTKDTLVNVKIKVPEDAKLGDKYTVALAFQTVNAPKAGEFNFGSAFETRFSIEVVGEAQSYADKEESSGYTWIIYAVLGLLVLAGLYYYKKKKDADITAQ